MSVIIPLVLLACGALPLIAAAALRRPEPRRVPVRRDGPRDGHRDTRR